MERRRVPETPPPVHHQPPPARDSSQFLALNATCHLPPSSTGLARNVSLAQGLRRDLPPRGYGRFAQSQGYRSGRAVRTAAMTSRIA
jgi:hypothetical protein